MNLAYSNDTATRIDPAMTTHRLRVVLIDDHVIVREGIHAVLEEEGDITVVAECGSGDEALRLPADLAPDIALVDLNMPGIGAVQTIKGMRQRYPAIRVMVFTSFGDDEMVRDTLEAGASGFLLKDALQEELIAGIRSVAAGQPYLAPVAQRQLMNLLRRPRQPESGLTPRELEVLQLIVKGCGNKRIGEYLGISEGTVKGYVSAIFDKLGVEDRTQAALLAVKRGMFPNPD